MYLEERIMNLQSALAFRASNHLTIGMALVVEIAYRAELINEREWKLIAGAYIVGLFIGLLDAFLRRNKVPDSK